MARHPTWPAKSAIAALPLAAVLAACEIDGITNLISPLNAFRETRLVADAGERDTLWEEAKQEIAAFGNYESRTDRRIPVIVLERAA